MVSVMEKQEEKSFALSSAWRIRGNSSEDTFEVWNGDNENELHLMTTEKTYDKAMLYVRRNATVGDTLTVDVVLTITE